MAAERQLLLSLLALQNGFIAQAQLQAAFGAWIADKSRELSTYLVQHAALQQEDLAFLDRMVDFHLMKFDGDASQSLADLSGCSSIAAELRSMAGEDAFVLRTLSHLPIRPDGGSTNDAVDAQATQTFGTIQQLPHSVTEKETARNGIKLDGISLDPSSGATSGAPSTYANSDRFRIVKEHARGGLGVLYVAEDQELRREVALKQIRKDRADFADYRAKFMREAEVTGQLEHPGIVPVYALGTDENGRPYYAMRFIKGEDLQTRLRAFHADRKAKKLPLDGSELRGLLRRFIDVCNAVDYAHDRGVLHRDLKPGNVMLGKHGETLVVDWGLAKTLGTRPGSKPDCLKEIQSELPISKEGSGPGTETQYGAFLGTPAYAPPEQMLGQLDRLGPASDVYSLGAILYELLTGQVAIRGSTLDEVITKCSRGDYETPRALEPSVPRPLDAICRKAMAVEPADRYATAFELRQDIERWLDDSPVAALREPLSVRATRWMRHHPAFTASMAATLLLTIVGAFVYGIISESHLSELKSKNTELGAKSLEIQRQSSAVEATNKELQDKNSEIEKRSTEVLEKSREVSAKSLELEAALARSTYFLAISRWNENRLKETWDFLFKVPIKYRGFEWRLARTQFDESEFTLFGHVGAVSSVSFNHNGTLIASGGADKTIRLWDAMTGAELKTMRGHNDAVVCVCFSPDGKRVASVSRDQALKIWDTNTGDELLGFVTCAPENLFPDSRWAKVHFSSDGTRLMVSGGDFHQSNTAVWNATTGKKLSAFEQSEWQMGDSSMLQYSPDGNLACRGGGGNYRELQILDVINVKINSTASTNRATNRSDEGPLICDPNAVTFSPTGATIASCNGTDKITLWDTGRGREIKSIETSRETHLTFSPDESRIASAGVDNDPFSFRIWDINRGVALKRFRGHIATVTSLCYSSNGSRIASGSRDGEIKVWDASLKIENENAEAFYGDRSVAGVKAAIVAKNLWELQDSTSGHFISLVNPRENHSTDSFGLGFSPSGREFISGYSDPSGFHKRIFHESTQTFTLWDTATGAELRTFRGRSNNLQAIAFAPDGNQVITGGNDGQITVLDATTGAELHNLKTSDGSVEVLVVGPDGLTAASVARNYEDLSLKLTIWDLVNETERWSVDVSGFIKLCRFSPDGKFIILGINNEIHFWEVASGRSVKKLEGHNGFVGRIEFNSDGNLLASESLVNTGTLNQSAEFKLWEVSSGMELLTLKNSTVFRKRAVWSAPLGHETNYLISDGNEIQFLGFSADSSQLFWQSSSDTTMSLSTASGEWSQSPKPETNLSLAPESPDGRWLAISFENRLSVVDRHFKNASEEKLRRSSSANPKPEWHRQQARLAEQREDWFAAAFHHAWQLHLEPDLRSEYDMLHEAVDKLKIRRSSISEKQKEAETLFLPQCIVQALALAKGTKLPTALDDDWLWSKIATGDAEVVSHATKLLFKDSEFHPSSELFRLQFATWLLAASDADRALGLMNLNGTKSLSPMKNWLLSRTLDVSQAIARLQEVEDSKYATFQDAMFHSVALRSAGRRVSALTRAQQALKLLPSTQGDSPDIARPAIIEQICLARIRMFLQKLCGRLKEETSIEKLLIEEERPVLRRLQTQNAFFREKVLEKEVPGKNGTHIVEEMHIGEVGFEQTVNVQLRAVDFLALKPLTQLTILNVAHTKLDDLALEGIGELSSLSHLNLWNTPVSDAGLGELGGLSKLTFLNIGYTKATLNGLRGLSLQNLEELYLNRVNLVSEGLGIVRNFKQLRTLSLWETNVADDDLHLLKELPNLALLDLEGTAISDVGLQNLGKIPQLKKIVLSRTKVTVYGIAKLKVQNPNCDIEKAGYPN